MESATPDIVFIMILIIPVHGIFLSLFFLIHAQRKPGPNFFMGILLLVLCSLSVIQLYNFRFTDFYLVHKGFRLFHELCVAPFLYLYTSILIEPRHKNKKLIRLLIILVAASLFFVCIGNLIIPGFVATALSMINGLYLLTSYYLVTGYFMKHSHGCRQLLHSDTSWIIILNVLVLLTILISAGIYELCPVKRLYLSQLPKGLVVYSIYCKILDNADFRTT